MLVLNHVHKLTRTFPWKTQTKQTLVTKTQHTQLYLFSSRHKYKYIFIYIFYIKAHGFVMKLFNCLKLSH